MTALLPIVTSNAVQQQVPTSSLVRLFLAGRTPRTLRAYRQDLAAFATWLGTDVDGAARELLERGPGAANQLLLTYRTALQDAQLAPATVNRRLAAIRSLVKLARTVGAVGWTLEVPGVRSERYRDTRGPGLPDVHQLLARAAERRDRKGVRDFAVLRLLFDLGLRRGEVVSLDVDDVDLEAGALAVFGKGRSAKVRITLPDPTGSALRAWLGLRGMEPGALFLNVDRARKGARVTGTSIYRIVRELGLELGVVVRPHGLRHAAITAALTLTAGNLQHVQRFSRHREVRTLTLYDDNRTDLGGEVARRVAAAV